MNGDRTFVSNMLRLTGSRGWTLKQLATEAGMSYTTVTNYSHSNTTPSLTSLRRIRSALGCTWEDLLEEWP